LEFEKVVGDSHDFFVLAKTGFIFVKYLRFFAALDKKQFC
jgi:hypothetical protein